MASGVGVDVRVRPPTAGEVETVAELRYEVSPESWLKFAGTREHAIAAIEACFRRRGTDASADVIQVAELGQRIAGLIATFPAAELRRRYLWSAVVSLPHMPPRNWPRVVAEMRREFATAPTLPGPALYVDSLVTAAEFRRTGVARVLLRDAEERARALGLPRLALDTDLGNEPARSLYESFGFVEWARRSPAKKTSGLAFYLKDVTPPGP